MTKHDDKEMTAASCRQYILHVARSLNHAFTYGDLEGPFKYGTLRNSVSILRKSEEILKLPKENPARFILKEWANRPEYKVESDNLPMGARVERVGQEMKVDFVSFVESLDWGELAYVHDVKVEFNAVRLDGVSSSSGWTVIVRRSFSGKRFSD